MESLKESAELHRQLVQLRTTPRFASAEVRYAEDGTGLVVLPRVPLPPGWTHKFTTLAFLLRRGWPYIPPSHFWTLHCPQSGRTEAHSQQGLFDWEPVDLRLHGGTLPQWTRQAVKYQDWADLRPPCTSKEERQQASIGSIRLKNGAATAIHC